MSTEENKALARRWLEEGFNQRNLDVADQVYAADYVSHDPSVPFEVRGPEGLKQLTAMYHSSFPDVRITVEEQIAEGDRVVTRWTGIGTHQGEFAGVPGTGKQATVTGITISRISSGKIAEEWINWDTMGLMQQIGAIPAPQQA